MRSIKLLNRSKNKRWGRYMRRRPRRKGRGRERPEVRISLMGLSTQVNGTNSIEMEKELWNGAMELNTKAPGKRTNGMDEDGSTTNLVISMKVYL
jgi:hypothetical protein